MFQSSNLNNYVPQFNCYGRIVTSLLAVYGRLSNTCFSVPTFYALPYCFLMSIVVGLVHPRL